LKIECNIIPVYLYNSSKKCLPLDSKGAGNW
jgi:hypothetical protein